jgi:hypothetical protein
MGGASSRGDVSRGCCGPRRPDMAKADLEPGDILVTAYTDPS